MNNLRKCLLLALIPLLISCNVGGDGSTTTEGNLTTSNTTTTSTGIVEEHYYQPSSLKLDLVDMYATQETEILGSLGTQKILVIPVDFTGSTCSAIAEGCAVAKENIRKSFFGESNETGWESVSSYYKKTSYGKLNIAGEVTDWFTLDLTTTQLENKSTDSYEATWYVLDKAIAWYKQKTGSQLTEYDTDNDGFLDAVWLVYSINENRSDDDSIYWAYTTWNNMSANKNNPVAGVYAWASYNFLKEGGYSTPTDAHTFIHETGHVLGLDDYYNYDGGKGFVGNVDMMDYNVGDHNAYSKMLMKWTTPKVVTGTGTITIAPFESSGDCILIRDNTWNESAFDEYFLLEYYTPTGLNEKDLVGYGGVKTFSTPSIKVFHVDSRLAKATWGTDTFYQFATNSYLDTITSFTGRWFTAIAASNTPSGSINRNYHLIELITSSGAKYSSTASAKDSDLFHEGDSFGVDRLDAFGFNDGTSLGFGFKVLSLNNEAATISFTKK